MVSNGVKVNWLWDSRLSEKEARKILKNEDNPKFDIYAERLFSRTSDPKMAFGIVNKVTFCKKWPTIKKHMRKDRWLTNRVAFWQTIYEHLYEKLKAEGIKIRQPQDETIPPERMKIAHKIRDMRIRSGYTQKDIAKKLGVIQQYISKIENGRENLSVDTLKRIADAFGKRMVVDLK